MRIFFLAGEASGDLYAGLVCRAIRAANPAAELFGVGGPEMQSAGVRIIRDLSGLGLFGFWEGLTQSRRAYVLTSELKSLLASVRPDVFVPVSYSGVNLPLASHARSLGIRVVYLSPPQLWAWGRWRAGALREAADKVICLFPFEEQFLRSLGINAVYLGNPLADSLSPCQSPIPNPQSAISNLQSPISNLLVLMPGSRPHEVNRHLPLMQEVANRLAHDVKDLDVRIVLPESLQGPESAVRNPQSAISNLQSPISNLQFPLHAAKSSQRWNLLRSAALILAASGTATLEAALLQIPLVVVYRLSAPSYLLARAFVRLPYFSLPNIILNRRAVPEFAQPHADEVYQAARNLLCSRELRNNAHRLTAELRRKLGPSGSTGRIAAEVLGQARR